MMNEGTRPPGWFDQGRRSGHAKPVDGVEVMLDYPSPFRLRLRVAVDAAGAVGAPEICGCRAPRNLRLRSPQKSAVAEPVIIRGGGAPSI